MLSKLNSTRNREDGFTLIELLIVVIIIGILAAVALPIFIDQQKVAVDASVKSDVRNSVTNVTNAQAQSTAFPATTKAAVSGAGTSIALTSNSITSVATKVSADLTNVPSLGTAYSLQGWNSGGKQYQGVAGKGGFEFSSVSGLFSQVSAAHPEATDGGAAVDPGSGTGSTGGSSQVAPTWTTSTANLPDGEVGSGYTAYTVTASGTPVPTFTSTDLKIKTGLDISAAGTLSGTPTTSGTFSVTITATNSKGSADKVFSIKVNPKPANVGTVSITTSSLPSGTVNTTYSGAQITSTTTGDAGTVTYAATGLPAGLAMNAAGAISGTPTASGSASVAIIATKTVGSSTTTDSKTLTLSVTTAVTGASFNGDSDPGFVLGGGATSFSTSATQYVSASRSYLLKTASLGYVTYDLSSANLTPGKSYTLSGWVFRQSSPTPNGSVTVRIDSPAGSGAGGFSIAASPADIWVQGSGTFTYEAGQKLRFQQGASQISFFDDIKITEN